MERFRVEEAGPYSGRSPRSSFILRSGRFPRGRPDRHAWPSGPPFHRLPDRRLTDVDRRIAHLDMDAFYASVELLSRPELAEVPVAIGGAGDPSRRGVVTTANYAARQFGIRSGMALRRARELCPGCVFLPANFDRYREVSRRFKAAVLEIAPVMEDRGIDEIYLDLGDVAGVELERGAMLGRRLKAAVRDATGLSCSIGIA